jgi:hypothetical protein
MACHDTPGINIQAFLFPTLIPVAEQNLFILIPDYDINPINNRITYKIYSFLVMKLVFAAHHSNLENFCFGFCIIAFWHKFRCASLTPAFGKKVS